MSLLLMELHDILLDVLESMSGGSSLGSTCGLGGLLLVLVGEPLEATLGSSQLGLRSGHTNSHGSLSELDVLAGLGLMLGRGSHLLVELLKLLSFLGVLVLGILHVIAGALHSVLHVVLRGLLGLELTGERLC